MTTNCREGYFPYGRQEEQDDEFSWLKREWENHKVGLIVMIAFLLFILLLFIGAWTRKNVEQIQKNRPAMTGPEYAGYSLRGVSSKLAMKKKPGPVKVAARMLRE